jgi:hypothetical protein
MQAHVPSTKDTFAPPLPLPYMVHTPNRRACGTLLSRLSGFHHHVSPNMLEKQVLGKWWKWCIGNIIT